MVSLAEHHGSKFTKLMFLGSSGTGKTGALESLVRAGYKLKILDLDNGLDSLREWVTKKCPDKLANVDFETRRDKYRVTQAGPVISGMPKAFTDSMGLMTKWSDESVPAEWGEDTIFVLDSLSAFGRAGFEWAKGMAPQVKDPRQWYGVAQKAVEDTLSLLTSEAFHCNVIVITHVKMIELPDGSVKGFANSIGQALGEVIPRYFNTMVLAESVGQGSNVKRRIKTVPTGTIDLKSPAPFKVQNEYDIEDGMAELFKALRS